VTTTNRPCKVCGRNRAPRFFTGPRGRICSTCRKKRTSASSHDRRVSETYGLRFGEYAQLLEAQDGRCAICLETRSQRLSVDHDHKSGLVRGLLCRRCNSQLLAKGARDRAEVLRRAADYLDNPPAPRHIGDRFYSKDKD
jgi:hypothetical protein